MTRRWIDELGKRARIAAESTKPDTDAHVRQAFARVQGELREAVAELERALSRGFTVSHLSDLSWLVEARVVAGPFTGTRFTFDQTTGSIQSDPSANFAQTQPTDHHTFAFDATNNSFTENGEPVGDEQLIERALRPFLRGMFSPS